jgi:DNA invertase Pin-like site-specific DNA recombinase
MALYDPAVSGADPIEARPGFAALLDRIESNGVRTVLVEDASRFARDLVTQELGILALIGRGVRVLTASGDDLTNTDDPFKVAMHQIAGLSPTRCGGRGHARWGRWESPPQACPLGRVSDQF